MKACLVINYVESWYTTDIRTRELHNSEGKAIKRSNVDIAFTQILWSLMCFLLSNDFHIRSIYTNVVRHPPSALLHTGSLIESDQVLTIKRKGVTVCASTGEEVAHRFEDKKPTGQLSGQVELAVTELSSMCPISGKEETEGLPQILCFKSHQKKDKHEKTGGTIVWCCLR